MTNKTYWVYILASRKNGTLYTGVTNSLERRVWQHKNKKADGFTKRYGVSQLVYFEEFRDVTNAIAREKQIKAGSRTKKIALIERENPAGSTWPPSGSSKPSRAHPPLSLRGAKRRSNPSGISVIRLGDQRPPVTAIRQEFQLDRHVASLLAMTIGTVHCPVHAGVFRRATRARSSAPARSTPLIGLLR